MFAFQVFKNKDPERTWSKSGSPKKKPLLLLVPIAKREGLDFKELTYTMPPSLASRILKEEVYKENLVAQPAPAVGHDSLTEWAPLAHSWFMKPIMGKASFERLPSDLDLLREGDKLFYVFISSSEYGEFLGIVLVFLYRCFVRDSDIFWFGVEDGYTRVQISRSEIISLGRESKIVALRGLHDAIAKRAEPVEPATSKKRFVTSAPAPIPERPKKSLAEWVKLDSDVAVASLVQIPSSARLTRSYEEIKELRVKDRMFISLPSNRRVGLAFDLVRAAVDVDASESLTFLGKPPERSHYYVDIQVSKDSLTPLISENRVYIDAYVPDKRFPSGGIFGYLAAPVEDFHGGGRRRGRSRSQGRKQCSGKDTETGLRCKRPCIPGKRMCAAHQTKRDRRRRSKSRSRSRNTRNTSDMQDFLWDF